jgi:hypothetical protein
MKRLFILLALTSCISTEVIGFSEPIGLADTTTKAKPHKPLPPIPPTDTTDGREQIGFNPTVEDWEQADTTDIEI